MNATKEYTYNNRENLHYDRAYQTLKLKTLPREGTKPPRVVIELYANKANIIHDDLALISHRISRPDRIDDLISELWKMKAWLLREIEREREGSI